MSAGRRSIAPATLAAPKARRTVLLPTSPGSVNHEDLGLPAEAGSQGINAISYQTPPLWGMPNSRLGADATGHGSGEGQATTGSPGSQRDVYPDMTGVPLTAHDSGPAWAANPPPYDSCIRNTSAV